MAAGLLLFLALSTVRGGLHSLRHSFVSRLAERNVPVVLTSELVGHSRIDTTQNTYTRVRGSQAERIEALREILN